MEAYMSKLTPIFAVALFGSIAACATAPEPIPEPIVIEAPVPVLTCAPVSSLKAVTIPAETKVQYSTTSVDGREGPSIKRTIVVKPAQIFYVDSEGREVLDICEDVTIGDTGPGVGAVLEGDG